MRALRTIRLRIRSLLRGRRVEQELLAELHAHLERQIQFHRDAGLPPAEARQAALREFGNVPLILDECRDARRVGLLEDVVKDVIYGWRLLARSPAFLAAAVLSLALGIGANTAIFSLVDTVLLRQLPVDRPQELVFLHSAGTAGIGATPPYPYFDRVRRETTAFAGMAAMAADQLRVEVDGRIEQVFGQVVSVSYFDMLGLTPAAGRLMTPADATLDPLVAVIGYGYWQRRFGGAPAAIGKTVAFRNRTYTIVGVTPPRFWGLDPGRQVELSLPIEAERDMLANTETWGWYSAIGRLRPGTAVEQAAAEADVVFQSFMNDQRQPEELRRTRFDHIELTAAARGGDQLRGRFTAPLSVLMLVAAIVLVIACTNLGSLLLARGSARAREFAIRLATGARAGRLFRQLLTETLLLFLLGAGASLLVARATIEALTGFFAIGRNPIQLDVQYDWRLAAYAMGMALIAGLATGLWPALRAVGTDPQAAMKDGDTRVAGSRRVGAAGRLLIAGQVALSLVLLVAAVVFARTMVNLRDVDVGFSATRVLTMSLDPFLAGDDVATQREQFWTRALERVRAMPGVRAASLSVLTPLSGRDTGRAVRVPGFEPRHRLEGTVKLNHVSEGYLDTFGIELVAGRAFTARDRQGAVKVAMLNEEAARFYFGGRSAIGESITFGDSGAYQVVGVMRNHKHRNLREETPRFAFVPLWQPVDRNTRITLAVSSDQPSATVTRAVASQVRAVHPATLVSDVIGVEEQIDATLVSERLLATLATGFAALALGLAAIGLYGILSYSVARRRAEFGVRMALGAPRARVASGVFREVLIQVAIGTAIGLPAAWAISRAAEGLLFGVSSADPGNYFTSVVVLALVACMAAWLPARRACSVDLAETLRRE